MRTEQQENIVSCIKSHVENGTSALLLVSSIAGSGKTHILTEIADEIEHKNGLYLAYNKSIATESKGKFPSTVNCLTTHSLAYRAVVTPEKGKYKLTGYFGYRDIQEKMKYEDKCYVADLINEFCLSKYISFSDFAEEYGISDRISEVCTRYLNKMQEGEIDITHAFYLKLFHAYLATGYVEYEDFDFIMLDEAGDLNEVTLEIFKLLPSKIKIAVGDPYQNIYSFNHTINCFEELKDEGELFHMSQSFRVNENIAARIERFCKAVMSPDMEFKGVETDNNIVTRAFISRTNAALIGKMIELNNERTPYGLVRKAKDIFKVPLMLCSLRYQGKINDPAYKHLQEYVDDWYEDYMLKENYKNVLSYIASKEPDDIQLQQSISLILKHKSRVIFDTYKEAANHESSDQNFTLTTAHSAKGLEFDEVVLAQDLNDSVAKVVEAVEVGELTTEDRVFLDNVYLYYVAASRAKKSLRNDTALINTRPLL